jgi:prepilin-type N-terminal cleavage/methylation domain-containing protein
MKIRREANGRRRGFSLLEMMVATAMMATLMTSVVVVMRSGYAVWNAQEADIDVLENGYGVLRHFVQQLRQADSVSTISAASDTTGDLSFLTVSGTTRTWSHNGAPEEVYFNNGTSNQLLANKIDTLTFTAYEADGVTQTTNVADIQVVKCTVQVTLPQGGGVTRTISCRAWVRTW